jgi:hypothetical protein
MKFFAGVGLVVGIFLIGAFIALLFSEKENKGKYKLDLISYLITGILTITISILLMFNFTSWWKLFCTGALVVVLSIFLLVITISDRKGKKYVKYKMVGHGKNKHITASNDDEDDTISAEAQNPTK